MKGFLKQLKDNYLAIISLFIAVLALVHNAKLYEKSELNRNVRTASFEILMKLGQLQQEINQIHFGTDSKGSLILAWGNIALISDLSKLLPKTVSQSAEKLLQAWNENYKDIQENRESVNLISENIDETRKAVLDVIMHLN